MFLPKPDAHGIIRISNGILIDLPRAHIVCQKAFEAYQEKRGIHAILKHAFDAPQSRFIPHGVRRGSPRHVLWLFFTALTDRRETSENVYRASTELCADSPWIYGPGSGSSHQSINHYLERLTEKVSLLEVVVNPVQHVLFENEDFDDLLPINTADAITFADPLVILNAIDEEIAIVSMHEMTAIESILRKKKVGSPGQSARYWPHIAATLYRKFGGDPLEIFRRYPSIDAFLAFKDDWKRQTGYDPFPGIGPKIASLMTMFYDELGLMSMPKDAMPVDVHLQRFALETGIIRYEGDRRLVNEVVERCARALYCDICNERGWPHADFSHAIWFLSKRLCSNCHRKKIAQTLCPTFDHCHGSIASGSYFLKGVWIIKHRPKNGGVIHR